MPEKGIVKPPVTPRIVGIFIVLWILMMSINQYARWKNAAAARMATPPDAGATEPLPGPPPGVPQNEFNGPLAPFTAKVIDPSGAGIPGVTVTFTTSRFKGRSADGLRIYLKSPASGSVTTAGDGSFTISGQQGATLNIDEIRKEGYVAAEEARPSIDAHGPLVSGWHPLLLMLPTTGTPEVHAWEKTATLPAGVSSFRFDLDSGELSESGNASFRFTPPEFDPAAASPAIQFKRTAEIAIRGAETQREDAGAPLAPLEGYEAATRASVYGDAHFSHHSEERFYYRRDGHYGRLVIAVSSPSPDSESRVWLRNEFNRDGGRNTRPLPPADPEQLRQLPQTYARLRQRRLDQANESGKLKGMPVQELTALIGPPDHKEDGTLIYTLPLVFRTFQWSFAVIEDQVSAFTTSAIEE